MAGTFGGPLENVTFVECSPSVELTYRKSRGLREYCRYSLLLKVKSEKRLAETNKQKNHRKANAWMIFFFFPLSQKYCDHVDRRLHGYRVMTQPGRSVAREDKR